MSALRKIIKDQHNTLIIRHQPVYPELYFKTLNTPHTQQNEPDIKQIETLISSHKRLCALKNVISQNASLDEVTFNLIKYKLAMDDFNSRTFPWLKNQIKNFKRKNALFVAEKTYRSLILNGVIGARKHKGILPLILLATRRFNIALISSGYSSQKERARILSEFHRVFALSDHTVCHKTLESRIFTPSSFNRKVYAVDQKAKSRRNIHQDCEYFDTGTLNCLFGKDYCHRYFNKIHQIIKK